MKRKSYRGVIILAYFHRNCPISAVLVLLLFLWRFGYSSITYFSTAACFLLLSLYNTVGCLKKWDHIYCSYQNACRQNMTPQYIRWWEMTFGDKYGISIVFAIFAVLLIFVGAFDTGPINN